MSGLKILEGGSVKEIMQSPEFKEFEEHCREYIAQVEREAKEGLTDEELSWFNRWSKGEALDWDSIPSKAHDAIMHMISRGLG